MFKFENLLRNEYFPEELPPCFNTNSLANKHNEIQQILSDVHINESSVPLTFSGFKNRNARRKFAIANPYHYCKIVKTIVDNSEAIFDIFKKSKASLTCPIEKSPKKNESYHKPTSGIVESKKIIEQLYQNNLFEVRLDISSFFDSVYTHSVPWAIHTKAIAKQNKTDALFGNVLDGNLQYMNYSQTNGLLVGNAASRIISEIILCTVDDAIQKRVPNIVYKRYVDDYYIYAKDIVEVNKIMAVFRQELAKYELTINENKIEINESPFIYGKPWVEQMKQYLYLKSDVFLSKVIMEYNNYNDIAILKYGLKVIQFQKYNEKTWKHIQSILINIWVKFPSLSNIFVIIFKSNERFINKTLIKRAIYTILNNNINLSNDQEVIWMLWFIKVFNIEISQLYIEKILKSSNWLAIIIMLDIIKNKNMKKNATIRRYLENLYDYIKEEFYIDSNAQKLMMTEVWLLSYEADKNKWLNLSNERIFMFARKSEFFKKLLELNIEFYNSEYNYEIPEYKIKENTFITKEEFSKIVKKLEKAINHKVEGNNKVSIELTDKELDLFESIHNAASDEGY